MAVVLYSKNINYKPKLALATGAKTTGRAYSASGPGTSCRSVRFGHNRVSGSYLIHQKQKEKYWDKTICCVTPKNVYSKRKRLEIFERSKHFKLVLHDKNGRYNIVFIINNKHRLSGTYRVTIIIQVIFSCCVVLFSQLTLASSSIRSERFPFGWSNFVLFEHCHFIHLV